MPRQSGWFIRASMVYLAVGLTFGALMLANKGVAFDSHLDALLPVHIEFLLAGWMLQLALGVAYWILPRNVEGLPRGNETMLWLSLIFLNVGILIVQVNTIFNAAWFALLGRILEAASALIFLLVAWRRVRSSR